MTPEGYKTQPLSDELEQRIQNRVRFLKAQSPHTPIHSVPIVEAGINALEWVLSEAEAMKAEASKPPTHVGPRMVRQEQPRWNSHCHVCGHVHQSNGECGTNMGGAGMCQCLGPKVTA